MEVIFKSDSVENLNLLIQLAQKLNVETNLFKSNKVKTKKLDLEESAKLYAELYKNDEEINDWMDLIDNNLE